MTMTFLLTDDNRAKLKTLAAELGVKPNRAINLLIQNAQIGEVQRREPVAVLSKKNNRCDASTLTETSITAVRA